MFGLRDVSLAQPPPMHPQSPTFPILQKTNKQKTAKVRNSELTLAWPSPAEPGGPAVLTSLGRSS